MANRNHELTLRWLTASGALAWVLGLGAIVTVNNRGPLAAIGYVLLAWSYTGGPIAFLLLLNLLGRQKPGCFVVLALILPPLVLGASAFGTHSYVHDLLETATAKSRGLTQDARIEADLRSLAALKQLNSIQHPKDFGFLLQEAANKKPAIRATVAQVLGELANPLGAETLLALLQDADANVRASASASLGKLQAETQLDPETKAKIAKALA